MLLMYLTRFNEGNRFGADLDIAWKGYDFDIINELDEEDYIWQDNHRSKSVAITDEGQINGRSGIESGLYQLNSL